MSTDLDFAMVTLDGHHSAYVDDGMATLARKGDGLTPGRVVMVFDRDGWATLHNVESRFSSRGRALVGIGPRIPWPDGSVAARKVCDYEAPSPEAQQGSEGERS